jgi:hypothetical protein
MSAQDEEMKAKSVLGKHRRDEGSSSSSSTNPLKDAEDLAKSKRHRHENHVRSLKFLDAERRNWLPSIHRVDDRPSIDASRIAISDAFGDASESSFLNRDFTLMYEFATEALKYDRFNLKAMFYRIKWLLHMREFKTVVELASTVKEQEASATGWHGNVLLMEARAYISLGEFQKAMDVATRVVDCCTKFKVLAEVFENFGQEQQSVQARAKAVLCALPKETELASEEFFQLKESLKARAVKHTAEHNKTKKPEDKDGRCAVCIDNVADHMIVGCCHMCLCAVCALKIDPFFPLSNDLRMKQLTPVDIKCPICRANSKKIVRVIST